MHGTWFLDDGVCRQGCRVAGFSGGVAGVLFVITNPLRHTQSIFPHSLQKSARLLSVHLTATPVPLVSECLNAVDVFEGGARKGSEK